MKTQIRFTCVVLALIAIAMGITTCGGEETGIFVPGSGAALMGVQMNSVYVAVAPPPIDNLDYDDPDFDMIGADFETAALNRTSDTVLVRFRPTLSPGARAEWGIGTQDQRPFGYYDLRVPATFDADDFVYFRVRSEDGLTECYYRYYIWVRSPVTELASVYVGAYESHMEMETQKDPNDPDKEIQVEVEVVDLDERMFADIASPGSTHINAGTGVLSIMLKQANGADVIAAPYDGSSTVEYALTTSSSAVPVWGTSIRFNLVNLNYLYIRITAQNTVDVAIYKFRVEVDQIATIKTLTFKDTTVTPVIEYPVVGLGTPRSQTYWDTVALGNYKTADMPGAGFAVAIETVDTRATYEYCLIPNKNSSAGSASFGTAGNVVFNGTNVLAIKVTSGNGLVNRIYKIEVELLAANFDKQPMSDYYYYYNANAKAPDGTTSLYTHLNITATGSEAVFSGNHGASSVRPLSVTLDRTGTFTYQWWHANSWYGAYGFDKDDHIGYVAFDGPDGARQEHWEGFVDDAWYRANLDEKGNTSLFNGGNWFVYPVPGAQIPGATSATYTPTVANKVPLIGNTTSATHYYWVVVTDTATNRTATSKRTAIITEWDPSKKHYIINLNEDLWEMDGTVKKVYSARNPKVFTYHREKYTFPIQLDSTFDINDYTFATAQALFFLKNGTPWIQNWTQGDIGFEDDTGPLVLYYNLTNNNATLGLEGGGKEPSGGSLDKKPTKITIKPAGEKPPNAMPADILPSSLLDANGMPLQRAAGAAGGPLQGDAQGWFTGFIEMVELHFEGPARE